MKMTTKESLRKDKEYLNEVLELYNRDIFSDYIIGIHLRPVKRDKNLTEILVKVAKEVKESLKDLGIEIAYVNRDDVVFFIKQYAHPFQGRLQDILSIITGKANMAFSQLQECKTDNYLFGHIYGFRNLISAYKLMLTIYRENNTETKREWIKEMGEKHNIKISGNLARDEMKIASETGKGFETIDKKDLNGILITEENEEIIPSFQFEETIKQIKVLEVE